MFKIVLPLAMLFFVGCCCAGNKKNPCYGVDCGDGSFCVVTASNLAACVCDKAAAAEGSGCVGECFPSCEGRECGPNGCGGVCGPGCANGFCQLNGRCAEVSSNCTDGWCLIPAGNYQMGSPADEPCRYDNEGPVHVVRITRPFFMKQSDVTQGEWRSLIGNNPSYFSSCGDDCPVENVTWHEAVYYANLLSDKEGFELCYTLDDCHKEPGEGMACNVVHFYGLGCNGYRLPTEAEWEYATRAGTTTPFWMGDDSEHGNADPCGNSTPFKSGLAEVAWYSHNSGGKTHPVAQLKPNPWGLYDVYGNVWKWMNDWYDHCYYQYARDFWVDPEGPEVGIARAGRGGAYLSDVRNVRSATRNGSPGDRYEDLGFRLVRTASAAP